MHVAPRRASLRITNRPWENTVKGAVQARLEVMANRVKTNLTITAWPFAAVAVVTSNISNAGGVVATGAYNSGTGIHAEVAAINALGAVAWVNPHTITTSLEPCHRCAVIMDAFVQTYGWTVQAPARAYASNYPGAYNLPAAIYTVVAANLATIPANELIHYEDKIKSLICGFGVI